MGAWVNTILSVSFVSLLSLVGVVYLALNDDKLRKIILFLVSFSAGALFGGAFIHLIPEASEKISDGSVMALFIILGILIFFVLEKFIHWRHCHIPTSKKHPHPLGIMNLVGDGLHNLIDGMVIAASYLTSVQLGITTTIAVTLHEIPQEISDLGVLIHAGYSKTKALFFNFISALTAVLGAVIVLLVGTKVNHLVLYLLPITAGGFIYIAGSDLIPELKKECIPAYKNIAQLIGIILGILLMYTLSFLG